MHIRNRFEGRQSESDSKEKEGEGEEGHVETLKKSHHEEVEKAESENSRDNHKGEEEEEELEMTTFIKIRSYILLYPFFPVWIIFKYLFCFFGALWLKAIKLGHKSSNNQYVKLTYKAIYGFVLCFYGSYFTTATAALEGFEIAASADIERAEESIKDIVKHYKIHSGENKCSSSDLKDHGLDKRSSMHIFQKFENETTVFLQNAHPQKIMTAIGAVGKGLIIVLSTVKFEFLKTAILALATAEHLEHSVSFLYEEPLKSVMGKKYWKWVEMLVGIIAKSLGIILAALYEEVVHIGSGAVIGATTLVRSVIRIITLFRTGNSEAGLDKTKADEIAGLILGLAGIFFQFYYCKKLPRSVAVILGPLYILQLTLCGIVGCEEEEEEEEPEETEGTEASSEAD